MRAQKSFLIAVICLFMGFIATISLAQEAQDGFPTGEAGAGANLVITSVSGPATVDDNGTLKVTYTVKNQGDVTSGAYLVALYLSADNTIDPAVDRLLDKVMFTTGLAPGKTTKTTTNVLVPNDGLSGKYYYGAVVASSSKASAKKVSRVRYSLADNNETVIDHKTGLIWQRADDGQQRDWADASQYCENLVLGGKEDWHLPRVDELETIVDYSKDDPAIDPPFSCQLTSYWSGSTYALDRDDAWGVDFADGAAHCYYKGYWNYVRCVRGLKVPGMPTGVSATAGNAQATVNFTAPASDGGSPITSYTVTSNPEGKTASGTSSPITVTGLTNGTPYTFSVKATNAIGTGRASSPSNSVTPATVPGAPTIGTATAGNAQATVTFTPPASNGGSPITSYTVTSSPGGITKTGAASPITVTGLTNGTAYTFTVKATNMIGTGPASSPSNSVTPHF